MTEKHLFPGYFLRIGHADAFNHTFGGDFIVCGADCVNCEKPLMLHLSLDTADPRLALFDLIEAGIKRLRILYCMRCALCWHDFSYRIIDDTRIEVLEAYRGARMWDDWQEAVGVDAFTPRAVSLCPTPHRLQSLWDKLNADKDLTRKEEFEVAVYTGQFSPVGGIHPCIDVVNQIGGRSFLCQRLADPPCPYCASIAGGQSETSMVFLASLTNDERQAFKVSHDGVQIVAFLCRSCRTVKIVHSI